MLESRRKINFLPTSNTLEMPSNISKLEESKKDLINRVTQRRQELLQEMDTLWAAEQYRKQYDKADEENDTRGAIHALNSLFDKLKLFERVSAEQLTLKAQQWSLSDVRQIQLDLAKHGVSVGDTALVARMADSLNKHGNSIKEVISFEDQLDKLMKEDWVALNGRHLTTAITVDWLKAETELNVGNHSRTNRYDMVLISVVNYVAPHTCPAYRFLG